MDDVNLSSPISTVNGTSRPRKWLFIDGAASFGGHEIMLLRWIEELLRTGEVAPRLVAREHARLVEAVPQHVLAGMLPARASVRGGRFSRYQADVRQLRELVAREKPDVCIFASGSLGDQLLLTTLLKWSGERVMVYVPLLDTFEHMGYRLGKWKDRFVRHFYGRVPDGWIVITEGQSAQFLSWAKPRGAVRLLANTVGLPFEHAPALVPQEISSSGRLRVLVLGRMDAAQKGLDMLLAQLLAMPEPQLRTYHFGFIGEGPYRETLESLWREHLRLRDCISLGPWQSSLEAMKDFDVLLLPSRFEGVPLVMLEALALGLPVVASDLPGTRAYLEDECLFPAGALGHAFELLENLKDVDTRRRLALEGRKVYQARASSTAFAKSVSSLSIAIGEKG